MLKTEIVNEILDIQELTHDKRLQAWREIYYQPIEVLKSILDALQEGRKAERQLDNGIASRKWKSKKMMAIRRERNKLRETF